MAAIIGKRHLVVGNVTVGRVLVDAGVVVNLSFLETYHYTRKQHPENTGLPVHF